MTHDARSRAPDQKEDLTASLANRLRQSLQVCSMHTVGPLAAYSDCLRAVSAGEITYSEFRAIGMNLIAMSAGYIDKARGASSDTVAMKKIDREERMIRFVYALFRGSDEESLECPAEQLQIRNLSG